MNTNSLPTEISTKAKNKCLLPDCKKCKNIHLFSGFKAFYLLIVAVATLSCVPQKKIRFYQDSKGSTISATHKVPNYKVQSGDVLFIRVQSIDEKSSAFINGPVKSQSSAQFQQSEEYLYFNGYEVGSNGAILWAYSKCLIRNNLFFMGKNY